jgi:hypothetical protein
MFLEGLEENHEKYALKLSFPRVWTSAELHGFITQKIVLFKYDD